MSDPFSDTRMAAGYAAARPAVHPHILARLRRWLGDAPLACALDVGCGAGLSTAPLLPLADRCLGLDPSAAMVALAAASVRAARFCVGRAEALPVADGSVGLITAAGSLNYADVGAFFGEAQRALTPAGCVAVYDFSTGGAFADGGELGRWFGAFVTRYPFPEHDGQAVSPALLAERAAGFTVARAEHFAIPLTLSPEFYVGYLLTETNVHAAVQRGETLDALRSWITDTAAPLFGGRPRDILFRGYLALLRRA